jgi:hypothetical protein
MTSLANAAFRQAAKKVLERAEATGTPVIVWEDGAVKAVPPSEFLKVGRVRRKKKP